MADKRAPAPDKKRKRPGPGGPGQARRRNCYFCREHIDEIDWKNIGQLRRSMSEKGKIRSRRITGTCRRHQRQLAVAIKRAREMALLPYIAD
jgi:small subunit ribosomal protein S18